MGLSVVYRATEALVPYAQNARTHSELQVRQIADSIEEFGFTNPVLIDEGDGIIAGHGRVLAAKLLGREEVPCIVLEHLTEAQKRAYVLADNKIAANAGWDTALLAVELGALKDAGFDLDVIGFDPLELKDLIGADAAVRQGKTGDDDAPAAEPGPAVSRAGDIWLLGRHRLMVGDATAPGDVMRLLDGQEANLVWTDPPYNVAYEGKAGAIAGDDQAAEDFAAFLLRAFRNAYEAVKAGGVIYVAHADTEREAFTHAFLEAGFKLAQVLIWVKQAATLSRQDYNWQHEPILYGWREGDAHYFAGDFTLTTVIDDDINVEKLKREDLLRIVREIRARTPTTVIREDRPHRSELHPTMKPVALVTRAIEASSHEGNLVFDPFGGSGTTLIAAEKTNRRAALLEIDPRYADVIVKRWEAFTARTARLAGTDLPFSEVARSRVSP